MPNIDPYHDDGNNVEYDINNVRLPPSPNSEEREGQENRG